MYPFLMNFFWKSSSLFFDLRTFSPGFSGMAQSRANEVEQSRANEVEHRRANEVEQSRANEVEQSRANEVEQSRANEVEHPRSTIFQEILSQDFCEDFFQIIYLDGSRGYIDVPFSDELFLEIFFTFF